MEQDGKKETQNLQFQFVWKFLISNTSSYSQKAYYIFYFYSFTHT